MQIPLDNKKPVLQLVHWLDVQDEQLVYVKIHYLHTDVLVSR